MIQVMNAKALRLAALKKAQTGWSINKISGGLNQPPRPLHRRVYFLTYLYTSFACTAAA